MDYKLPYYMAYPMPFEYDDERKRDRIWNICKVCIRMQ